LDAPPRELNANASGKNLGVILMDCRREATFSSRPHILTVASADPVANNLEPAVTAIQFIELPWSEIV